VHQPRGQSSCPKQGIPTGLAQQSNEAFLRCAEISPFYLFSPCGVRKFHVEIFDSSLQKIYLQLRHKSVDWNSAQKTWSASVYDIAKIVFVCTGNGVKGKDLVKCDGSMMWNFV